MVRNKFYSIFLSFLTVFIFDVASQELPKVMYVNSRDGLNKRDVPSADGKKIGVLLHGERVVVYERSDDVIIDGITNCWYKISGNRGGWCWIFGGYLSDKMPVDADPILGRWNTDKGENFYWDFTPQHKIWSGKKETDIGIYGNWTLFENILTIDLIPTEFMSYSIEKIIIRITVIDNDNILFLYGDGSTEKLTRNDNII
jgi:hypothetical protein